MERENLMKWWCAVTLAQHKLIMQLSAGGLGLLSIMLSDAAIKQPLIMWAYLCGLVMFAVSITSTVMLLNLTAAKIEHDLLGNGVENPNESVTANILQIVSFLIALACLVGIGVWSALDSYAIYVYH